MTNDKVQIDFNKLSFYLKLKHIKINDLAEMMNIKRQTIYNWKLKGTTIDNIMLMAHYLNVDVEDLI